MTEREKEYERLDKIADLLDAMADVVADLKVDCMTEIQKEKDRSVEVQRFLDRVENAIMYPTKGGK